MPKVAKCLIPVLVLSLIVGQLWMPAPASAADKITKIDPQYMSTPEEDISKMPGKKKGMSTATWVMVAIGVAAVAALGAGGGGGGGGSNGDPQASSGDISVGW